VERHGFEPYRRGTSSPLPALNTQTGQVLCRTDSCHTSLVFVDFLADIVATRLRRKEVHVILDNLSAHKTNGVAQFLVAHPNVYLHFTTTYASWLNQIELWFSKMERELIAGDIFRSGVIYGGRSSATFATVIRRRNRSVGPTAILAIGSLLVLFQMLRATKEQ
jgi:hypothetical protein